jgi:hypothetical protein
MSVDGDNLSGLGITGFLQAFSGSNFKRAETTQLHHAICSQSVLEFVKELIEYSMDILAINAGLFEYTIDYFGFREFTTHKRSSFLENLIRFGNEAALKPRFLASTVSMPY